MFFTHKNAFEGNIHGLNGILNMVMIYVSCITTTLNFNSDPLMINEWLK